MQKVALRVSTGVRLVVWREDDMYHARVADSIVAAQICLPIDLFEVIAELSGLDLDHSGQAAEAMALSTRAQRLLAAGDEPVGDAIDELGLGPQ